MSGQDVVDEMQVLMEFCDEVIAARRSLERAHDECRREVEQWDARPLAERLGREEYREHTAVINWHENYVRKWRRRVLRLMHRLWVQKMGDGPQWRTRRSWKMKRSSMGIDGRRMEQLRI
jgi:hypothetical protein